MLPHRANPAGLNFRERQVYIRTSFKSRHCSRPSDASCQNRTHAPQQKQRRHSITLKTGKAQNEEMFSGPTPIADVTEQCHHFRLVPRGDISLREYYAF